MYKEEEAMETHDLDRHIIMIVIVDMLISNNLLILTQAGNSCVSIINNAPKILSLEHLASYSYSWGSNDLPLVFISLYRRSHHL